MKSSKFSSIHIIIFQIASSSNSNGKYFVFWNPRHKLHWSHSSCFYELTNISNILFPDAFGFSFDWRLSWSHLFTRATFIFGPIANTTVKTGLRIRFLHLYKWIGNEINHDKYCELHCFHYKTLFHLDQS